VRIVTPSPLLRDVAEILKPVRSDVTVIGAVAVQIALDGHDVALSPTGDIDAGTSVERAAEVVRHLESRGFRRSDEPHERSFTWIGENLKVQLVRSFHPFAKPPAKGLPVNNLVNELVRYRWSVAFEEDPEDALFWAATPAALVALKEAAFGRTRPATDEPVHRDFSDVALLLDNEGERIVGEVASDSQMRARVLRAAERLRGEPEALEGAVRQLVATGQEQTPREAEAMVVRAVGDFIADLE
jgi:hypothetical protein